MQHAAATPSLPGGGPEHLGYLEEQDDPGADVDTTDEAPPDVWFVFDLPGGGQLQVPVSVLADARRVGPPARATGRAVSASSRPTGETEEQAGQHVAA